MLNSNSLINLFGIKCTSPFNQAYRKITYVSTSLHLNNQDLMLRMATVDMYKWTWPMSINHFEQYKC